MKVTYIKDRAAIVVASPANTLPNQVRGVVWNTCVDIGVWNRCRSAATLREVRQMTVIRNSAVQVFG